MHPLISPPYYRHITRTPTDIHVELHRTYGWNYRIYMYNLHNIHVELYQAYMYNYTQCWVVTRH